MACVRTIAVTNQKGGVGKTTTTANLAAALAHRGHNVCVVDLDPQAHLTIHFGIDPANVPVSMYDVMTRGAPLTRAAVLVEPMLTVIPATIDLAAAEVELAGEVGREHVLRSRFNDEALPYELVLIDCPPSLGLLTLNALAATGEILIPLQPHFLALQGLSRLLETVSLVQQRINPSLKVCGIVFCMYESGTRLAVEVSEDIHAFFEAARGGDTPWSGVHIFETLVRRNIKLAECPSYGTTISHYDASSHGAQDYAALAEEFLSIGREEQPEPPANAAPATDAAEGAAASAAPSAPSGGASAVEGVEQTPAPAPAASAEPLDAGDEAQTPPADPPQAAHDRPTT